MDFWVAHPRVEEYVMDLLLLLLLAMIMRLNYYDDINLSMPLEINQARAPTSTISTMPLSIPSYAADNS